MDEQDLKINLSAGANLEKARRVNLQVEGLMDELVIDKRKKGKEVYFDAKCQKSMLEEIPLYYVANGLEFGTIFQNALKSVTEA